MNDAITAIAKVYPKPGKKDDLRALLTKMAASVRKNEPGCLAYRMHEPQGGGDFFVCYELYGSKEAFDFHRAAPHLTEFRAQMKELIAKPNEAEFYTPITE
ncbi:MAG: antibiotic biosynthesis monooxygenase [Candidatus Rokuibacteriota bacterium]|nr:MAG: antibiotic biosynthesis monooxygenase [Candidatus Rokubacteria bacterium]